MSAGMSVHGLNAYYDRFLAVADLDLEIERGLITAFIGPSGCGKSTVLRALNRLHEVPPRRRVEGTVLLDDLDIYDPRLDVNQVRRRIGMVFQQPNPFPTMSIRDNAIAGLRLAERRPPKHVLDEAAESALRRANLWDEVKDRLHEPGVSLSGGQQQRLCIARAIAVDPDVLLMDEPASALDPLSTYAIEDLMQRLKKDVTIVVVTHNMEQAARVSDITAFFSISGEGQPGRLVEVAPTELLFTNPARPRTEDYITGRFG